MPNETHRAPLRYNISDFFSSLLEVYKGIYGNSVSIPANLTHGIAIEFVQNAR
jgi:hypothetical protein